MKMKKIEKELSKLEEKKLKKPSPRLDKKIMKLEKKKVKLEKWLKIKLPFRILIKAATAWIIIGGVCYACNYIPIIKEIKMAATGVIAYVAPESVSKVLDVVTLNIGVSNNDFEWLKSTLNSYINGDIKIEMAGDFGARATYDGTRYMYSVNGREATEEEYNQYVAENNKKIDSITQEVFGTSSINEINSMSPSDIIMKVATNSTSELVSQVLDMINLTSESRQRLEEDINRALKIIPKLNNNQMDELIDFVINIAQGVNEQSEDVVTEVDATMELEEIN